MISRNTGLCSSVNSSYFHVRKLPAELFSLFCQTKRCLRNTRIQSSSKPTPGFRLFFFSVLKKVVMSEASTFLSDNTNKARGKNLSFYLFQGATEYFYSCRQIVFLFCQTKSCRQNTSIQATPKQTNKHLGFF